MPEVLFRFNSKSFIENSFTGVVGIEARLCWGCSGDFKLEGSELGISVSRSLRDSQGWGRCWQRAGLRQGQAGVTHS